MVMNRIVLTDGESGLLIVLRDMTASYMAEKCAANSLLMFRTS